MRNGGPTVSPVDDEQLRRIEAARDDPLFDGVGAAEALALVAEVRRLREWLTVMDRAPDDAEAPCGWCLELQDWARRALAGDHLRAAPAADEDETDGD